MKKVFLIAAVATVLLTGCAGNPEGKKAEVVDSTSVSRVDQDKNVGEPFTVDNTQSKVVWTGTKVSGKHTGTVTVKEGVFYVENNAITGGNFVLDLTTINTTDLKGEYKDKLDGHLKAEDFFNVEKYPTAQFKVQQVEALEAGKVKVTGDLTIKDVTKTIAFEASSSIATAEQIKVDADFNIVRGDWGINYEGKQDDLISKEINFKISLVANHAK